MEHILSPDLPAYLCYAIVLALGALVAGGTINALLAAQSSRWGYWNTWALFAAHTAIPVALFWFLDYTSALRDSSLFGALVVAFGYKQIFAGGVQGITMPGQTPRLWQPFEAWVSQIKDKIVTVDQKSRDLFNTRVRAHIAGSPERLTQLRDLTFANTQDPTALSNQLAALLATPPPPTASPESFAQWLHSEEVQLLLSDLRRSQPSSYDFLLMETQTVKFWMYKNWRRSTRSRIAAWLVPITLLLGVGLAAWTVLSNHTVALKYAQWRFTKANASPTEHFRAQEYLLGRMGAASQAPDSTDQIGAIIAPLTLKLRFKDISPQTAEDILGLLVESQSCKADPVVIPQLIEALRNPNDAIRLQTLRSLSRIRENHYPRVPPPEADVIPKWIPNKDESAISIDQHVRSWENWWGTTAMSVKCQ